jgi:hypothetical protein
VAYRQGCAGCARGSGGCRPFDGAGIPGIGLEPLLPDYEARMAGLARNVEEQRITMLMGIVEAR